MEWKDFFLNQFEIEIFFQFFLSKISFRRIIKILKILLIFIKIFKVHLLESTLFIFFYKMRTTRRRSKSNYKKVYRKEVYGKKFKANVNRNKFSIKNFNNK